MIRPSRLLLAFTAAAAFIIAPSVAAAATPPATSDGRNCDDNAIMYCGALSQDEFLTKFNQGDTKHTGSDLQFIYAQFNIDRDEISQAVTGTATKDGRIVVDGQTVATDAVSWGRQAINGSTKEGDLYKAPNSAAFRSDNLPALVYLKDGVFEWAVLEACGNMIQATATTQAPAPAATTPAPPAPAPAPQPTPAALPETGAAAGLIGLGGLSAVAAASRTYKRSRRDLRHAQRSR